MGRPWMGALLRDEEAWGLITGQQYRGPSRHERNARLKKIRVIPHTNK